MFLTTAFGIFVMSSSGVCARVCFRGRLLLTHFASILSRHFYHSLFCKQPMGCDAQLALAGMQIGRRKLSGGGWFSGKIFGESGGGAKYPENDRRNVRIPNGEPNPKYNNDRTEQNPKLRCWVCFPSLILMQDYMFLSASVMIRPTLGHAQRQTAFNSLYNRSPSW